MISLNTFILASTNWKFKKEAQGDAIQTRVTFRHLTSVSLGAPHVSVSSAVSNVTQKVLI